MPIRVALVEDDDELRDALRSSLAHDPGITMCGDHSEVPSFLSALPDMRPDVVVMDIGLPGISGVEGVRSASAILPGVQFLMCTVRDDDDTLFEALCAGATGYLVKEASPAQLATAIKELHAGGSPMSPGIARRVIRALTHRNRPHPGVRLLTERERMVLDELAQGYRYKEIADRLGVSIDTVRSHVRSIYEKLQVRSRTDAVNKLHPR